MAAYSKHCHPVGTRVPYAYVMEDFCDRKAEEISFLRDTKSVGELSELIVAVALGRAGYIVAKPLGEKSRYDLIIDKDGTLSRVQVKTGRLRNGAILFHPYSTHTHRKGAACRPYVNEVEFFGVYCPELLSVYLVPIEATRALAEHCAYGRRRMGSALRSGGLSHI